MLALVQFARIWYIFSEPLVQEGVSDLVTLLLVQVLSCTTKLDTYWLGFFSVEIFVVKTCFPQKLAAAILSDKVLLVAAAEVAAHLPLLRASGAWTITYHIFSVSTSSLFYNVVCFVNSSLFQSISAEFSLLATIRDVVLTSHKHKWTQYLRSCHSDHNSAIMWKRDNKVIWVEDEVNRNIFNLRSLYYIIFKFTQNQRYLEQYTYLSII